MTPISATKRYAQVAMTTASVGWESLKGASAHRHEQVRQDDRHAGTADSRTAARRVGTDRRRCRVGIGQARQTA